MLELAQLPTREAGRPLSAGLVGGQRLCQPLAEHACSRASTPGGWGDLKRWEGRGVQGVCEALVVPAGLPPQGRDRCTHHLQLGSPHASHPQNQTDAQMRRWRLVAAHGGVT